MPTKEPLTLQSSDEIWTALRERLILTRWTTDFPNDEWAYGTVNVPQRVSHGLD